MYLTFSASIAPALSYTLLANVAIVVVAEGGQVTTLSKVSIMSVIVTEFEEPLKAPLIVTLSVIVVVSVAILFFIYLFKFINCPFYT